MQVGLASPESAWGRRQAEEGLQETVLSLRLRVGSARGMTGSLQALLAFPGGDKASGPRTVRTQLVLRQGRAAEAEGQEGSCAERAR